MHYHCKPYYQPYKHCKHLKVQTIILPLRPDGTKGGLQPDISWFNTIAYHKHMMRKVLCSALRLTFPMVFSDVVTISLTSVLLADRTES